MKNNKKSVMVIIALMLVVLGGYFVAGTYAKYTSEVSGTSNASIAGWKWTIGNEDLKNIIDTKESKYSLSLFDTIYEEDTKTSEEHVSANNIAPGTGGSFTISIANKSQVDATYKYDLSIENNLNAKLQFKVGENGEWTSDIAMLSKTETDIAKETGTDNATIYWKWAYNESESQDELDTQAGLNAGANVENNNDVVVTAKLVLTQKN